MKPSFNVFSYYSVNALSWAVLGLYTVSLSWIILATTQSTGSVGLFYLTASLSSLIITPFIGPFLEDAAHIRSIIVMSAAARSMALMIPLMLIVLEFPPIHVISFVFLVAVLFGPSNSVFGAATDGLMLRCYSGSDRAKIAKRVSLIRQIALATGFGCAGITIAAVGAEITAAIAAVLGVVSAAVCLSPSCQAQTILDHRDYRMPGFHVRLTEGLRLIRVSPMLLVPCVVTGLGFSISQMSNALLAPIVTGQHKSASDFGLITSAWACGAIAATILVNVSSVKAISGINRFFVLLSLGLLSILFATLSSTFAQVAVFACMGAVFSYLRITAAFDIALHTPNEKIGQVQVALSNFVSLIAIVVYLIPTLLHRLPPAATFSIWGGGIVIVSLGVLIFKKISTARSSNHIEKRGSYWHGRG